MPIYSFESKQGERIDEFFHASERPAWGERIKRNGKTYTRIVEGGSATTIENEHIAYQLPKWHPDAPHHTSSGFCAFKTKAQRQEFMAKNPRFGWDR